MINIQGDEPLIQGALIDNLVHYLKKNPDIPVVTAVKRINGMPTEEPNIVKVVAGQLKDKKVALYFSRAGIPFYRNQDQSNSFFLRHIGIYGFQKTALLDFANLEKSHLEEAESLEQLRWLENGFAVRVGLTEHPSFCVDTPADLEEARRRAGAL